MLPTKFHVYWPFVSGEEVKNRFSRWRPCHHLGILIGAILAIFDLQVTLRLSTKFQVNGLPVQEKKWKIDFQDGLHGSHLGFPIRTVLAIFDLQVTQWFFQPSFKSVGLSVQEKKWTRAVVGQRSSPAGYILYCNIFIIKKIKMK